MILGLFVLLATLSHEYEEPEYLPDWYLEDEPATTYQDTTSHEPTGEFARWLEEARLRYPPRLVLPAPAVPKAPEKTNPPPLP